jgi:hypothetical protein
MSPALASQYLAEPNLLFANNGLAVDPKRGIAAHGPRSLDESEGAQLRIGLIGTGETISLARQWIQDAATGVHGVKDRPSFPGFMGDRGFHVSLQFHDEWNAILFRKEIDDILKPGKRKTTRFDELLSLADQKLSVICRKERQPELLVIALPDALLQKCYSIEYRDAQQGLVRRNLRRSLKAIAMKHRLPTQLIREATSRGQSKDYASEIAWDFFVGMYYKGGWFPWAPTGLPSGSCYLGVSFYRLNPAVPEIQTSIVQAFDEHGEGLVLRGPDFRWDPAKNASRSPHLSSEKAVELINRAREQYEQERQQTPQRVVIHKTSPFWDDERAGLEQSLQNWVSSYDLVALRAQTDIRLFPLNSYPPCRGTWFSLGNHDFLYSTGYIPATGEFHANHVPAAVQLTDHIGYDTPRQQLLQEVLVLTKMNWNSARLGGLMPITVRFARRVGDILRETTEDIQPMANYKFYM